MNAKSSAILVVVMMVVVATAALQASAAEPASLACQLKCWTFPYPPGGRDDCLRKCGDKVVTTTQGQCNLGCLLSKCLHLHPDAMEAKACENSCEEGCRQS